MFERLKTWIKGGLQRMAANTGMAREFKDIFELGGVPAYSQFYYFGIFIWKYLYRGYYAPWHMIPAPTIKDPLAKRKMYRMDMAKAVSAELASLIWSEACGVNVSATGFKPSTDNPDDALGRFVDSVLRENAFSTKMQESIEQAMALGDGTLKVLYDAEKKKICIGYGMADQFVPTAWDNAKVSEGVFVSRRAKDGYYYTRLEWHEWNGETYALTTTVPDYQADSSQVNFPGGFLRIYGWTTDTDVYFMFFEAEVSPVAMKLELGSQQTLAHQNADGNWVLNEIPDYGEQLAKCQRYFQLYSSADLRPAKAVDCRPTMRADPSQSTIVVNSTTYYYNTADL